jgi:hypothetical protein
MQLSNDVKKPNCFVCGRTDFKNYKELALHIMENKETHGKSLKFAAAILMDVKRLNAKQDFSQRVPLSEEDREKKLATRREISGKEKSSLCSCPICNSPHMSSLPIEFVYSPTAWRKGKSLVVACDDCNGKSLRY